MAMSRSLGGRLLTRRPPMWTSPAVISSSPATMRRAEVFPHPDGPTKTRNSRSWTVRFTSFTATTLPNIFTRSFRTTSAILRLPGLFPYYNYYTLRVSGGASPDHTSIHIGPRHAPIHWRQED